LILLLYTKCKRYIWTTRQGHFSSST